MCTQGLSIKIVHGNQMIAMMGPNGIGECTRQSDVLILSGSQERDRLMPMIDLKDGNGRQYNDDCADYGKIMQQAKSPWETRTGHRLSLCLGRIGQVYGSPFSQVLMLRRENRVVTNLLLTRAETMDL